MPVLCSSDWVKRIQFYYDPEDRKSNSSCRFPRLYWQTTRISKVSPFRVGDLIFRGNFRILEKLHFLKNALLTIPSDRRTHKLFSSAFLVPLITLHDSTFFYNFLCILILITAEHYLSLPIFFCKWIVYCLCINLCISHLGIILLHIWICCRQCLLQFFCIVS